MYLRTTPPPVKIQIDARACRPKSKIVPTSRLPLSAPARAHGEVSRGNEGPAALKRIFEESARRIKKILEILKCRDSDTEADTVKKFRPMHCLGFAIHYFYISVVMNSVKHNIFRYDTGTERILF